MVSQGFTMIYNDFGPLPSVYANVVPKSKSWAPRAALQTWWAVFWATVGATPWAAVLVAAGVTAAHLE